MKVTLRLLRYVGLLVLLMPAMAFAADGSAASSGFLGVPALVYQTTDNGGEYSVTIQILVIMTLLTLLPSLLIMMTAFVRIVVVMAILRQALGLQQTPSNQIILGLSLFLTLFVMMPAFQTINETAIQPYINETMSPKQALETAVVPLREFMLGQTREDDLQMFIRISGETDIASADETPIHILIPAFVTSELKTAFQIGFLIFIPFLIIDLVIASILMAMGMMMLSPVIISLPFKIMLFVLIDGWALVMGTLANSFGTI